jgi:hypothetical protein
MAEMEAAHATLAVSHNLGSGAHAPGEDVSCDLLV